jgi:hypothetical protein
MVFPEQAILQLSLLLVSLFFVAFRYPLDSQHHLQCHNNLNSQLVHLQSEGLRRYVFTGF